MQKVDLSDFLALTAVVISVIAGMCLAAGAETVTVHMERGDSYYQSGNYKAALEEFRAATKVDPGYLRGWESMGWAYQKLGETDRAIDTWRSLKAIHPDPSVLLNRIARAYTAEQEYDLALAAYERSVEAKPGQRDVLVAICKVLYWAGRYPDAVVQCRRFLSTYPEADEIRQLLARLQMNEEIADYQAAIDNWQRLIMAEPNEPQTRIALAKAYYRSESYEKACETARGALKLNPQSVSALEILLIASIRIEQYEHAQDAIDRLRAVDPNHPDIVTGPARIHYQRAMRFYGDGNYDSALKEFLSAKALAPGLSRLSENIGWTYRHLGQMDEAIRIWQELLAAHPNDAHILNLIAGAHADKRVFDQALLIYDRSLGIDPAQKEARFSRAKVKRWIGSYAESADELRLLIDEYPEDTLIRHELAKCLMPLQRYDDVIRHYRELTSAEPNELSYSIGLAKALYLREQYREALEIAGDVLTRNPCNLAALDLLADDAEFLGDYQSACQLIESALAIDSNSVSRLNRLADCAATIGDYPLVQRATEESLRLAESQPTMRLLYAHSLRINGHPDEAESQYLELLTCNPNHIPAMVGLKEVSVDRGDYKGGLAYLEQILSIDSTNIHVILEKANLLAYEGQYDESTKLLERLRERVTSREVVLALLYHDLTRNQRSNSVRLANFKAQMELLSELGYSAVTAEDLVEAWKGERKLSRRTVLITFDDARRDGFECADGVLQDLSFGATMFVPICVVEATDPFYCQWPQIEQYVGTGRWEIQSHGNSAHWDIVTNEAGHEGTFLAHRQWLDGENRPETDSEYRGRIDSDYRVSKDILENRFNTKVNAFSFPKGNFGQIECACADSVVSNLTSIKEHYALSFIQDRYGLNLVGDDPYLLKRLEVHETWTSGQLRDHLAMNDPVRLVTLSLAKVRRWAGHNEQAIALYDELLKDNPLDTEALLGKAMAYKNHGRFFKARTLLDRVLEQGGTDEVALAQREEVDRLTAPVVDSFFSYFEDDDDRQRLKWGSSVQLPVSDELTIEASWARAELDDKDFGKVRENEYSLRTIYWLGEIRYDLSYIFRDFLGADDAHNYLLKADMPLFFDNVMFTHGYRSEETAKATVQDVRYHENAISIYQAVSERLSAYCTLRRNDFTDDNWRSNFKITGLYRFFDDPRFFAGCEFLHDDTDFLSRVYYTPDQLRMVQAVLRAQGPVLENLTYNLRYAVGPAWERGANEKIVQNGSLSLRYEASDTVELGMLVGFSDTPTYGNEYASVNLQYRF